MYTTALINTSDSERCAGKQVRCLAYQKTISSYLLIYHKVSEFFPTSVSAIQRMHLDTQNTLKAEDHCFLKVRKLNKTFTNRKWVSKHKGYNLIFEISSWEGFDSRLIQSLVRQYSTYNCRKSVQMFLILHATNNLLNMYFKILSLIHLRIFSGYFFLIMAIFILKFPLAILMQN